MAKIPKSTPEKVYNVSQLRKKSIHSPYEIAIKDARRRNRESATPSYTISEICHDNNSSTNIDNDDFKSLEIAASDPVERHRLEEIINDPDFQMDIARSDSPNLDTNLNGLFAHLRVALNRIQQTQRTNEKVKLTEKQDEIRDKIKQSKSTTQHQARIFFVNTISTLALSAALFVPDLKGMQDNFKQISDTSQAIVNVLKTSSDADLGEINNLISLGHQDLQELERKTQSISTKFSSINDSLANMQISMRVNS